LVHGRSITRRHAWVRGRMSMTIRGISTGRILECSPNFSTPVLRNDVSRQSLSTASSTERPAVSRAHAMIRGSICSISDSGES
jgi:hypothetical protein